MKLCLRCRQPIPSRRYALARYCSSKCREDANNEKTARRRKRDRHIVGEKK